MSWYNPSPEEAADEYYYARGRYYNAAAERNAAQHKANTLANERGRVVSQSNECKAEKMNFEKRIKDICSIVASLIGSSYDGSPPIFLLVNAPRAISNFNGETQKVDNMIGQCVKCVGVTTTSVYDVFKDNSVDADPQLSSALSACKAEIERLKQAVRDLQNKINALDDQTQRLNAQINSYNATAAQWRRVMDNSAYDMCHYKKYM